MYNRLYSFLHKKEVKFSLQFDFHQKYSTTHRLTHLIDKMRYEIEQSNLSKTQVDRDKNKNK